VNLRQRWAHVLSVAEAPRSVGDQDAALRMAMALGESVSPATVGCSVTERTGATYRTLTSANALSFVLDQTQYDAQAGPCLSVADQGIVQRLDTLTDRGPYPQFAAAAVARGVHSSLSVPLPDPRRPAALNFYASTPAAFEPERGRAVADLLARCVATLLPGGIAVVVPAAGRDDLAAVRSRRSQMDRALRELMAAQGLSRPEAFAELVQRAQAEGRSVHAVVEDLLGRTDWAVTS